MDETKAQQISYFGHLLHEHEEYVKAQRIKFDLVHGQIHQALTDKIAELEESPLD